MCVSKVGKVYTAKRRKRGFKVVMPASFSNPPKYFAIFQRYTYHKGILHFAYLHNSFRWTPCKLNKVFPLGFICFEYLKDAEKYKQQMINSGYRDIKVVITHAPKGSTITRVIEEDTWSAFSTDQLIVGIEVD